MTPEERMDATRCRNDTQRNHIKYVRETGVSIMHVMQGENPATPEWSYTIGLWHNYQHPEVVIVGLRSDLTQIILNNLNISIRDEGRSFVEGTSASDAIDEYICYFKKVMQENYGEWLSGDDWFYGDGAFPVVQMLWPNTSHIYPWDDKADDFLRWVQPVLTSIPAKPS